MLIAMVGTFIFFTSCSSDEDEPGKTPSAVKAVDLGLSVKWASCNIGATKPEEYGNYYAWGETSTKSFYNDISYKHCTGDIEEGITKYCDDSRGTNDNKYTLDPEDDVAHVIWGGTWRMPTKNEQDELLNKCTWTWTTLNGVNGYEVKSKLNGNSIFLPAAGYIKNEENRTITTYGEYWSSSLHSHGCDGAHSISFNEERLFGGDDGFRPYGCSVRAVCQ